VAADGFKMDEVFFKSVLPAQESLVLEDTSLAMPAEENIISPTKVNSYEKSLRVHQQVQLTLARRGKRAASNGKAFVLGYLSLSVIIYLFRIGGRGFSHFFKVCSTVQPFRKTYKTERIKHSATETGAVEGIETSFKKRTLIFFNVFLWVMYFFNLCCLPLHRKLESKAPELTLERAVNLLTQDNEDTLICAASLIQNQCFNSADAKKMVFYLHGIVKLLPLLQNDNEEVQRAAAGALRNIVFQNNENKMEVKENGGVGTILDVLKSSRDVETRRQLTGLLWNLSSHDLLKEHLSREALPVLTKTVLVPSSGLSEGENPKDELLADSEVFHNATGCLRNVSSAGPDGRKAMRECENLIDSLVYYIRGTIADYKPDDKSTENCVCILHNLSYQIEAELPQKYAKEIHESRQNSAPKAKSPGCFGYRSAKITERQCPLLEEKANPHGIEWLWSAITVRMYLSLMARSLRHFTQEAAIGALQNITAGNGMVTEAIAHTIVQRENGLQQVRKMLQEGESDVKRTAVSLVKNLSRYRELHADIVKQVLPELVGMLPNNDTGSDVPTEVTASLCHILINLSQNETQHVKAILNHGALPKIINISTKDTGYGPTRAGQAACILLHSMWNHSELHGAYKKGGYRKSDFINARTTKAVNSLRD
uniref:Plakophilin 2 n=1 Tax=Myripristis murdjan TaxID=586833 RepID=A0A667WSY9_9TELE